MQTVLLRLPYQTVRILEIFQTNNEADVMLKLSVKFAQQKYGNYYCGNRITTPKVLQVFNNPTSTCFLFFCYRN